MPGDIGYAPTWPFPVLYKVVRGASGERVTTAKPDDHSTGLLEAFLKAGAELVAEGADGLTTTCGFLSIYHMWTVPSSQGDCSTVIRSLASICPACLCART
jgi:hypothetical protein